MSQQTGTETSGSVPSEVGNHQYTTCYKPYSSKYYSFCVMILTTKQIITHHYIIADVLGLAQVKVGCVKKNNADTVFIIQKDITINMAISFNPKAAYIFVLSFNFIKVYIKVLNHWICWIERLDLP